MFDLSDAGNREKYLAGNKKLQNYAAKYAEVLITGYVPADCIEVVDVNALSDSESHSEGYEQSDYTADDEDSDYTPDDIESLESGASKITIK